MELSKTSDALEIIYQELYEGNPKRLAELVGITESVIFCLEDADYEGHSLTMFSFHCHSFMLS